MMDATQVHLALRTLGMSIPAGEADSREIGAGTSEALRTLQARFGLPSTGDLDAGTEAAAAAALNACLGPRGVTGRVYLDDGRPAAGLTVRLYGRGFGGTSELVGEAVTNKQGFYGIPYDEGMDAGGLELRTVDRGGEELSLTRPKHQPDPQEVVNVVAPANIRPLAAEYRRLAGDLGAQLGGLDRLREARATDEQHDLAVLRKATGWDARLIGLAAKAVRGGTDAGISDEALYGLFRAGLPHDLDSLALVRPEAVARSLKLTKQAGVIGLTHAQITEARSAFEEFSRTTRRSAVTPGTLSSPAEMLEHAPIGADARRVFEDLYLSHPEEDGERLWRRARQKGLSEEALEALRLQGKLAFLTLNNATLTEALQREIKSLDRLDELVDADLYRADMWKKRIRQSVAGGGAAIDRAIPSAYTGGTPTARLDAYTADLARKVRLSFPTRVVGRMIETDEFDLGERHGELKSSVSGFLKTASRLGFELGRTPVDGFISDHRDELFGSASERRIGDTTERVKTLQRLYQVTPTDAAMGELLASGCESALDLQKVRWQDLHERFDGRVSAEEWELVSTKSELVASVIYTFYGAIQQIANTAGTHATTPGGAQVEEATTNLTKHYPTLEGLFGSLDFCECDDCRSVLSPAAYLVDLLQLVNRDRFDWDAFRAAWRARHGGQEYTASYQKPYDELIARRPDLRDLPLTCENTNTALPYIDLVNEVLEYYVAEGKPQAHDTGAATTPDLIAEPQNTHAGAYTTLERALYPVGLPFDLWTETVRAFLQHLEIPLWRILETFRPTDKLFAPPTGGIDAYYRSAVFAEQLGLTPPEHAGLTGSSGWHELYGYGSEADARQALSSAKTLSRRLGVTYTQLTELVAAGFVNPRLAALVTLRKLGIAVEDVFRYKKHPRYRPLTAEESRALEDRLADLTKRFPNFDAKSWLNNTWSAGGFDKVVVLADPDADCDFDKTILRYADGTAVDAIVFLKLNLLVRLWRKLGWTIEETDRALEVLARPDAASLTPANLPGALRTALVYLSHLRMLEDELSLGTGARTKLLTLWSNLSTTGTSPLYEQLFLSNRTLATDPIFDDPRGKYLDRPKLFVREHLVALQGALSLTANDVERILAENGQQLAEAELSLPLVSVLYRYVLLANGLSLSVRDLIALKRLTGLDPFPQLAAQPIAELAEDGPFQQTVRFVEIAREVRQAGFSVEDLEYLLRHRHDPVGKYRLDPATAVGLVRSLAAEIDRIRAEHAMPEEPAMFSDDVLHQKLALIYPPEVTDEFMAMWAGTRAYEAAVDEVAPSMALAPEDFETEPEITVDYDPVSRVQRLSYRGVLLDSEKDRLTAAHPDELVSDLLDSVALQARRFFERELSDFLGLADYDSLFAPVPDRLEEESTGEEADEQQERERAKRRTVAEAFLPYLQGRLIQDLVIQTLATTLDFDLATTRALMTDIRLLEDPSEAGVPLVEAFAAGGDRGLTVTYFESPEATGTALQTVRLAEADTAGTTDTPSPTNARSARLQGYLEAPADGEYRLIAELEKASSEVELRFDHLAEPLLFGTAGQDDGRLDATVELAAGVPYGFTMDARKLGAGHARLLIAGHKLPEGSLARLTLRPAAAVERVGRGRLLLAKVIQLMVGLGLGERELRHVVTHPEDFDGLDLNALPTREADDTLVGAQRLFGQFLRLAEYARLKRDLNVAGDDLVDIFERARRVHPLSVSEADAVGELTGELCARFARLTRREPATVEAAATQLGLVAKSTVSDDRRRTQAPDFASEKGLRRIWEALRIVERLGVPVAAVVEWTKIVSAKADQAAIARDVRNAVKARYEPDGWRRVAQPIFEVLRRRRRDSLVDYLMHEEGLDRIEQLFDLFLLDPGMEPVVQTSRIQLAIASVQLFIQRCLLSLEPKVHPTAIVAEHWEWMKRYRTWEANRKIFLFPENWLEPEFRDDKSNLFAELESSLLQGELTAELAEDAFSAYLQGLDEVARLDVVSTYVEEMLGDPVANVLHVVGRTQNKPHRYFYRRYAHQSWTPWERIDAEIAGDHVAAVVWRGRLHLFWVTFLEQGEEHATSMSVEEVRYLPAGGALKKRIRAQLHWTERFQGKWAPGEMSADYGLPIVLEPGVEFRARDAFIHVSKEFQGGEERAVWIHLSPPVDQSFRLVSKNSPPWCEVPTLASWHSPSRPPSNPYSATTRSATKYVGSGSLTVTYTQRITTTVGEDPAYKAAIAEHISRTAEIVRGPDTFEILLPSKRLEAVTGVTDPGHVAGIVAPFFFSDSFANTFYVEPRLTQKTFEVWEEWHVNPPDPIDPVDPVEPCKPGEYSQWCYNGIPILDPYVPAPELGIQPRGAAWIDPVDADARFALVSRDDWITSSRTILEFDGALIGSEGPLARTKIVTTSVSDDVGPGEAVARESLVVDGVMSSETLKIVGGGGPTAATLEDFETGARAPRPPDESGRTAHSQRPASDRFTNF